MRGLSTIHSTPNSDNRHAIVIIGIVINNAELFFGSLRDRCPHAGPGRTRPAPRHVHRLSVSIALCSNGQAGHFIGQPADHRHQDWPVEINRPSGRPAPTPTPAVRLISTGQSWWR